MSHVRMARIHAIRSGNPNAMNGNVTDSPKAHANLRAWAKKASKHSYHGEKSRESGTSRIDEDMNHGGGTFLPNVRRKA